MKYKASSFKVGILALVALIVLLMTILWVKGRAFSTAERIEVQFKDVNGMRPGSGVQMMGLRVGQVESITPVISGNKCFVKMRFVITEPNVKIPSASTISIQQSGLIGEQFLEITPPKTRTIYVPIGGKSLIYKDDPVQMKLDDKYYDVGVIKNTLVVSTKTIPLEIRKNIKTSSVYKIEYIISLPGLVIPEFMTGQLIVDEGVSKMRIAPLDGTAISHPQQTSPYTVIEPMRISDFMDLQYKAAESLTETNQKVNDLLSDDLIADIKKSVVNINELTAQATTTMGKAEKLIQASYDDLGTMMSMLDRFTNDFSRITKSITDITEDKQFKPTLYETADSFNKLSKNLNKVLDNVDAKALANDLNAIMANVNEISTSVNLMTKDKKLKDQLNTTILNINKAMMNISSALELVNGLSPDKKQEVSSIVEDVSQTAKNLRKFSDKLNKRFLLFRLMF